MAMEDQRSSIFKMRPDEENPDSILESDLKDLKINKLNKKIGFLFILIPCLIAVVVFWSYKNINIKTSQIRNTNNEEYENFSKSFESKFSSLILDQKKLEESLNNKVVSIEKQTSLIQGNLNKIEKSIVNIQSSKLDKKKSASAMADINKDLVGIRKSIKNISSEIKANNKNYLNKINALSEAVDKTKNKLDQFQTEAVTRLAEKTDKKTLALELKKAHQSYQQDLRVIKKDFENEILSLQNEIKELLKSKKQDRPDKAPPASTKKKVSPLLIPELGNIIEQDIQ